MINKLNQLYFAVDRQKPTTCFILNDCIFPGIAVSIKMFARTEKVYLSVQSCIWTRNKAPVIVSNTFLGTEVCYLFVGQDILSCVL